MKKKSYSTPIDFEQIKAPTVGPKALLLEPLLILGSSILWLAVLPFAGLFCSFVALWKLTAGHA
ncbi:MAG: hypothetical protein ABIR29_04425 [Chthoniobacterales bacterium]